MHPSLPLLLTALLFPAAGRLRRFLLIHAFGGALFLSGILIHLYHGGELELRPLGLNQPGAWLILAALCLNAGVPPLYAWIPDAYPNCSSAGVIYQSSFTTKAAVCMLLKLFPGTEILVALGAVMAVYGIFYAVLENNVRRLLSYHIISQSGFMLAGIGAGTALSMDGAAAHAFSNILYKSILFMAAGAFIEATGKEKLTELGGMGRRMPAILSSI